MKSKMIRNIIIHFWRELKSGELTLLILCLIVAISASTSVGFFADRIQGAVNRQSNELLAGDLKLSSSQKIPVRYAELAKKQGLNIASYESMQGVVSIADKFTLVEIKAVSQAYPLRGQLKTKTTPQAMGVPELHIPNIGDIWVDTRLFNEMNLTLGQMLTLGEKTFTLKKILDFEPDRGGDIFNLSPRVMINTEDIAATKLIMPGSRVRYILLLSGENTALQNFQTAFKKNGNHNNTEDQPEIRLQTIEDTQPALKNALIRAEHFMNLAALISLALASCGIGLSAHQFAKKRYETVAILRALGTSKNTILTLFISTLILLSLTASIMGVIIGYIFQMGLVNLLAGLIAQTELPAPSLMPMFVGTLIGLITTLGFAVPPVLALSHTSPMRVLRSDLPTTNISTLARYVYAYAILCVLFLWRAGELKLGLIAITSLTVSFGLFYGFGYLLLTILGHFSLGTWARLGQKNILHRRETSLLQLTVIGFSLMILLLLTLVRQDLIVAWDKSLPTDTPNQFIINIPTTDVTQVKDWIIKNRQLPTEATRLNATDPENNANHMTFYPIIRGRITAVNGNAFSSDLYQDENAKRFAKREYNLSWTDQLPKGNTLVNGNFPPRVIEQLGTQSQDSQNLGNTSLNLSQKIIEISIEDRLAAILNFKIDDHITFSINGEKIETRISSMRSIDWGTINANFFILFPNNVLNDMPKTWMSAFYWPKAQQAQLSALIKSHPAVTLIDVGSITDRIKILIERVSLTITAILGFTLVAGILVLFTAIQTTQADRIREIALCKTFGAKRMVLRNALISEFAILGGLSGILTGIFAYLISLILIKFIFDLPSYPSPLTLLLGVIAGILIVLSSGYIGCRRFLNRSPMNILRSQG